MELSTNTTRENININKNQLPMSSFSLFKQENLHFLEIDSLLNESENRKLIFSFKELATNTLETPTVLHVELSKVRVINSTGLNFLLMLRNACEKWGTKLILNNPSSKMIQLLKITKLLPFFEYQNINKQSNREFNSSLVVVG